jgi:hypothetical protein
VIVTPSVVEPPLPSGFVGAAMGATYNPPEEMNPNCWLPPATPFTCHVTALLACPFTAAVNCCFARMATLAAVGETLTEVAAGVVGGLLVLGLLLFWLAQPAPITAKTLAIMHDHVARM